MRYLILAILGIIGAEALTPLIAVAKANPQLEAQQQAQQNQQRAAQEMAQRQEAGRQAQQQQQQQLQARQQQEQMMRTQEEQARNVQMQAMRSQQEQARRMQEQAQKAQQEQARNVQEQAQKAQQEQARNVQEQAHRAQQEQARNVQEQAQRAQQEQARNVQEQAQRAQQEQARNLQEQAQRAQQEQARNVQGQARSERAYQPQTPAAERNVASSIVNRPVKARPISGQSVPIAKAVPQPVLETNVNPTEKEHAQAVTKNLQAHLIAVPGNQAPLNNAPVIQRSINNYYNNRQVTINNRRVLINRQNTNVSYFQPNEYPTWYQPQPNWVLSNGFTIGDTIHCGLDWLRWGWHPYYGPPPEGFVCADDYFPTPWIYIPAYGLWRQPGVNAYSESGPDYDYTDPISVEVLEPKNVRVQDPYTGWMSERVINVVYFYNAFYYPEEERWGYMNRHGYFIWLDLDPDSQND